MRASAEIHRSARLEQARQSIVLLKFSAVSVQASNQALRRPGAKSGTIQSELCRLIGNRLADARPACRVIIEPGIQPKVRADLNVRVPDLAVTCAAWEPDEKLLREPLLVIETLSPSNKADTWANVWSYATIPSVREILVLHSAEIRGELLRREEGGSWPANPVTLGRDDMVALDAIDFVVPLAACYRTA